MKLKNRFIFNLQYFAEDNNDDDNNDDQGKSKTFTQEELDKAINKRLARERKVWEQKIEDEKAEERRLATLDAEERAKAEREKREKELADREAKIKMAEDKIECEKVLKERGLSTDFSQFLIGADAEITLSNINAFEKAFKDAVSAEVDTRIKGKTPDGTHQDDHKDGTVSKEDFKKLSLFEQNKLYQSSPEVYKSYYGA